MSAGRYEERDVLKVVMLKQANDGKWDPSSYGPVATLGPSSEIVGFVSPTVSKKAGEGKFFICDSGQLQTTVTNPWASYTFENPAGSGKTAHIVAVTLESDTVVWARFHRAPTTNLPTTVGVAHNAINLASTGAYASVMAVRADPMPAGMDGATTLTSRVTANAPIPLSLPPMFVTPGNKIGFGANLGGTGSASVAVYWYEE